MTTLCLTFVILTSVFLLQIQVIKSEKSEGIIEKLKIGLQMAGKIFGLDAASGVAQLVSDAFNRKNKDDTEKNNNGIFGRMLKMLTFDVTKIGAIVMNAFVFLAQLISTTLKSPALPEPNETPRKVRDGSPFNWVMDNTSPHLQDLLTEAKDERLINKIMESISMQSKGEDIGCVKLLICRISPFVKGMQKALKDKIEEYGDVIEEAEESNGRTLHMEALFRYLPEFKEFDEHGDDCKRRHKECRLID